MTTKNSRDLLDWFRSWTVAKYTELGVDDLLPSNMNIPLNNDNRVRAAIDFMLVEDVRLRTLVPVGFPLDAWPNAATEMDTEIAAQMPANIATLLDNWTDDNDVLVRRLLKAFYRVVGLQIALTREGVPT